MMKGCILVVEDNEDFLEARKSLLQAAGYTVLAAQTPEDALAILERRWVHLMLVDRRLRSIEPGDTSGPELIKAVDPVIPKIIVTKYPEWIDQRELNRYGLIDYLVVDEGPDALLEAIQKAFETYIRINFTLDIRYRGINPLGMAAEIRGVPEGDEETLRWAPELADLLRRLFTDCHQITVFRYQVSDDNTVLLRVIRDDGDVLPTVIVKCGMRNTLRRERDRYDSYIKDFRGQWGTRKVLYNETLRFGGIIYEITGATLEHIARLTTVYRDANADEIGHVLTRLFTETYKPWYKLGSQSYEKERLDVSYRRLLALNDSGFDAQFDREIDAICQNAHLLGLRSLQREGGVLTFQFPEALTAAYPDPARFIGRDDMAPSSAAWAITYGGVSGDSILVDRGKLACWLIDFARTGRGPILRDFAALEALIRWEWVSSRRMTALHRFEIALSRPDTLNVPLLLEADLPDDLHKARNVIETLRRLAADVEGASLQEYSIGLLFHALRIIMLGGSDAPYQNRPQPWRRAHALLSAAMLTQQLEQQLEKHTGKRLPTEPAHVVAECGPFRIDASGEVWIAGQLGPLAPPLSDMEFKLFRYLCQHANILCPRDDLFDALWPLDQVGDDVRTSAALDQHIRRLRKRIEPDASKPCYIHTIHGRGYKLVV